MFVQSSMKKIVRADDATANHSKLLCMYKYTQVASCMCYQYVCLTLSRRSPQVTEVTAITAGYMEVTSKLLYAQVAAHACMYQYSYCKVTPGYSS